MRPVGILGGTFDPVHIGHLRAAIEICDALDLAQVRLIPAHVPPHRSQPVASAAQRLAMLRLAVRGVAGLTVDARELERAGPSYTVDTLTDLRMQLGRRPLCLLVGEDAFLGLTTWHRWQDLFELAHLVVMQRPPLPGEPARELPPALARAVAGRWADSAQALAGSAAGLVWRQALPPLDISATRVRAALRAGRSVHFLVTDGCLRYIRRHHLYTD
ncbi:MAG: nicotinate-nucleotide adenylyltransferase [Immundisolibacter sp.]|uniref:nicotinate-nucleotide adenylyltransferase n=1 Tax=Immundisolibacter sp. TaxID=1934948 RepID=UPI0019C92E27|nr:nicotinate-nucleotide adenylyltransferase [Immundisolibacter sp.]MBC7161988.1 nicotinate-nucleotide adenylyltransferase [Immundisolibacter sp.]